MKQKGEKKLGTVHFRVDYDGLTRIVRDFWAEGEYTMALAIMTDSGIAIENAHDVIRGKLKMAPYPKDEKQGWLVPDNWQPRLESCLWGKYPDPDDHKFFRMINRYGVKPLCEAQNDIESVVNDLRRTVYSPDKIRLVNYLKKEKKYADEIYTFFNLPFPETVAVDCEPDEVLPYSDPFEKLKVLTGVGFEKGKATKFIPDPYSDPLNLLDGSPSRLQAYLDRELEKDKITEPPPPFPTDQPAKTGWLSPEGKTYGCSRTEHVWLASLLGFEKKQDIEKAGWVALHFTPFGYELAVSKGNDELPLTKKQIETLWVWAELHLKEKAKEFMKELLEAER